MKLLKEVLLKSVLDKKSHVVVTQDIDCVHAVGSGNLRGTSVTITMSEIF